MSDEHDGGGAMATAARPRQEGQAHSASSAVSAPFADARQEVEQGGVRSFLGDGSREGGSGGGSSALLTQFAEVSQTVEEGAVRSLMGAAAASPEPALTGTGFSYRHNWGPRRGQWTLRLNWGSVNARSRVLVSIAEGAGGGPDAGKFIGAARYTLHNVAPRAGGVDIWVNIEWSSDILLYVDYLVVNP